MCSICSRESHRYLDWSRESEDKILLSARCSTACRLRFCLFFVSMITSFSARFLAFASVLSDFAY